MFSGLREIETLYSQWRWGDAIFAVLENLPDYICLPNHQWHRGNQEISEDYHVLEYNQLYYLPELSPFISGGPVNNELTMKPLMASSGLLLEAFLACILDLGKGGTHSV